MKYTLFIYITFIKTLKLFLYKNIGCPYQLNQAQNRLIQYLGKGGMLSSESGCNNNKIIFFLR